MRPRKLAKVLIATRRTGTMAVFVNGTLAGSAVSPRYEAQRTEAAAEMSR